MHTESTVSSRLIAWGVASRARPGEKTCGDMHLVAPLPDGVLLAVVDGLGHGAEARAAAKIAIATLQRYAGEPLSILVSRCHNALFKTRGVVMTLALLSSAEGQVSWLGVGNVEAALLRAGGASGGGHCVLLRGMRLPGTLAEVAKCIADRALLRSGIVGYRLPALRPSTRPISRGDVLIFATDGIRADFVDGLEWSNSPQALADGILERHFKGSDDALVLAARYLGHHHE